MVNLISIKQASQILNVSKKTIYRYIKSKRLKAFKIGQWRIEESALKKLLKAND